MCSLSAPRSLNGPLFPGHPTWPPYPESLPILSPLSRATSASLPSVPLLPSMPSVEFSMYSYDSSLGGVSIVCPVSNTARQPQGLQHRPVSTTVSSWNDLSHACQPPQARRQETCTLYCLHRAGLRAYVPQEHRSKGLCERRTQKPHSSNTENPASRQISLLELLPSVTTPGDVEG